jgi:hypothetical protein
MFLGLESSFIRTAHHRKLKSRTRHRELQTIADERIGNSLQIPRLNVTQTVHRRHRNMQPIRCGFAWDNPRPTIVEWTAAWPPSRRLERN